MNEFLIAFKDYSNAELLKIIGNPDDYQLLAVEAAQSILESRHLTEEDIQKGKDEIELMRQEEELRLVKIKAIENKANDIKNSVFDAINPIRKTNPSQARIINALLVIFGIISVYQLYQEFDILKFMFTYPLAKWDIATFVYCLSLMLVPVGTFLFWKRKKTGWILLAYYLAYSAANIVYTYYLQVTRPPLAVPTGFLQLTEAHNPSISPIQIGTVLFYIGMFWSISIIKIRKIFGIGLKSLFIVIGLAILVVFVFRF